MRSVTVELPAELFAELEKATQDGGFRSAEDFVRCAVAEKLHEQRRGLVYDTVDRIKQGLAERGHTPHEILEEFERFRHDDRRG